MNDQLRQALLTVTRAASIRSGDLRHASVDRQAGIAESEQLDRCLNFVHSELLNAGRNVTPAPETIKVGDTISYRGTFGMDPLPTSAKVMDLTLTRDPRSKHGDDVPEVTLEQVRQNRVVFGLDNSRWCYAEQVRI